MPWLQRLRSWRWAIRVAGYTVILDACVLYPAPLRDFLLELAGSGIFRARWTNKIHDEWIENLLANRPELDRARLARTRQLMNDTVLENHGFVSCRVWSRQILAFTGNGSSRSAAVLIKSSRMASETDRPMSARASIA